MARIIGIGFPFARGGGSLPATVEDESAIDASVRQIIEVGRGERVMRPLAGSLVWTFVLDTNNALLQAKVQREVRRAIREQEPRVTVVNVDVGVGVNGEVTVDVVYKLSGRLNRTTVEIDSREAG